MDRDKFIMDNLQEKYDYLVNKGYDVCALFLQGSQNYQLDIYDDDYKSDIDAKAIVLPSIDDVVLNKQAVSTTIVMDNNEHIDVKKIVTAITTELNWYKAVFKDFWNKTSKDFRHLADLMDRNNCEKFSDYNKKYYNGELDYQIQEKNQIQQQHTLRQKKINDDYEWDR